MRKEQIVLALYITNKCNLKCDYCFVEKGNKTMDIKSAEEVIDYFLQKKNFDIIPTFLGGEPLVEWSLVKKIVGYCEKNGIKKFNLASNGLSIDRNKMNYFFKHKFTIQLSFDGIQESQDSSRKRSNGLGTFVELNRVLDLFLEYYKKISFEVRMTLTKKNLNFLAESVIFLLEKGFTKNRINIMPDIKGPWKNNDFIKLREEVRIIRKYYETLKIIPNIFINECIDKNHAGISSLSDKCYCGCGSRVICVDYDTKVYACFIPAGLEENKKKKFLIGNLNFNISTNKIHYKNTYLSCPVWTNLYGANALYIYKRFYKIWGEK